MSTGHGLYFLITNLQLNFKITLRRERAFRQLPIYQFGALSISHYLSLLEVTGVSGGPLLRYPIGLL